jgi:hexosaminidase
MINIFPLPTSVTPKTGDFKFDDYTLIDADPSCTNEGEFLRDMLSRGPGAYTGEADATEKAVILRTDQNEPELGAEGYKLDIRPNRIFIIGYRPAGVFYGIQTLRQMLPVQVEALDQVSNARWSVPCAQITDIPRYKWRGLLLDVSRHFFTPAEVERVLDYLAMNKMNTFHWHLVDDGGWRIEIKKYPLLTETGAWRTWSDVMWDYQHLHFPGSGTGDRVYGGYYTQTEIREIVKYAADRHITIIPEIEMPGHSLAALASYPSLVCTNPPLAEWTKRTSMPAPNVYCAGKETTFTFVKGVLDEVISLFPSSYIHIGGDEVDKFLWQNCPDCQKRMKDEGLKNTEELQSYFIKRVEKYLNSKGRRLIGWDEILQGGLAPNASVMSWRGTDGGIAAAQSGHDVVMTPTSHCYFDYSYDSISTDHVLSFVPTPPQLSATEAQHILGGQANLWTEMVPDLATIDDRLFPRLAAMAEVLWSGPGKETPAQFDSRLPAYYRRLSAMGVKYHGSKGQESSPKIVK